MSSTDDVIIAARRFGVRVYENRNIPPDEWVILGSGSEPEMPLPADWAVLTPEARKHMWAVWALSHDGVLLVHDRRTVLGG